MKTLDTPVERVMTRSVCTIDPERTVREAASVLVEAGIGSVVVTTPRRGILTKTDLVEGLSVGADPDDTPVTVLMSTPVQSVDPSTTLETAIERMDDAGIKRLLVERDGDVVGIVTTTDVVDHLSPDLDQIVAMYADGQ